MLAVVDAVPVVPDVEPVPVVVVGVVVPEVEPVLVAVAQGGKVDASVTPPL